ncbi:MAG: hypothetical protein NZ739_08170 [Verrucomicrobiae bacterium]|nr:hypothetical protein [Verrucomicrobiae bacterium]
MTNFIRFLFNDWQDSPLRVAVCYLCPNRDPARWAHFTTRFVRQYLANPPGKHPHQLVVLLNDTQPVKPEFSALHELPVQWWFEHDNSGYDLGAYNRFARATNFDLCIFIGTYAYPHKPGWLDHIMSHYYMYGPALWGQSKQPLPLRRGVFVLTQVFWCPPQFIRMFWPEHIEVAQRYNIEFGPNNFTARMLNSGYNVFVLGWDRLITPDRLRSDPNPEPLFKLE